MSATLASLRIRNLALVDDLLWEPEPGFTAITGETGAGKSVLIGALMLLLGERADRTLIRSGEETCVVEAVFEGARDERIARILEEAGAEPCEEGRLLLKRSIAVTGPGRQFANGSPCTLGLLRQLGGILVDLHGPHDHQSLFARDQQTRLLDAFAGARDLCEEFSSTRRTLTRLETERRELSEGEQSALRELDLLRHQCREIEEAAPDPAEEETLLARHRAAANASRILELLAAMSDRISGEESSLLAGASDLVRSARELVRLDPAAEGILSSVETLSEELAALDRDIQSRGGSLDSDPAAIAALEARLDTLETLKRKYGPTLADVSSFFEAASKRLTALEGRAIRPGELDAEIAAVKKRLEDLGARLTKVRSAAAKKLEKQIREGLADLGFAQCGFSVALIPGETTHGRETVEFLFSPNPGEESRPLRAIASSGEISRVMLAIKGTLAAQDDVSLLVFDEIDANVGGEIAARVARRMKSLAAGRQVFCITHLPQVAAAAARHFVVSKAIHQDRTRTLLETCAAESRVRELARMLGGQSSAALAHARALLAESKKS